MHQFQVYDLQINYIIIKCNYILVSFCWRWDLAISDACH